MFLDEGWRDQIGLRAIIEEGRSIYPGEIDRGNIPGPKPSTVRIWVEDGAGSLSIYSWAASTSSCLEFFWLLSGVRLPLSVAPALSFKGVPLPFRGAVQSLA